MIKIGKTINGVFILFCFVTVSAFVSLESDSTDGLLQVIDNYAKAESGHIIFEMKMIGDPGTNGSNKGEVFFKGHQMYSELMGRIAINTGKYYVILDNNSRVLYITNGHTKGDRSSQIGFLDELKSSLSKSRVTSSQSTNGHTVYTLSDINTGDLYSYTINDKKLISAYECRYANTSQHGITSVKINYSTMELNCKVTSDKFSIQNVVQFQGGIPKPIGKYTDYQLINGLK